MSTAVEKRWNAAVHEIPNCVLCRKFGVQAAHSNQLRGMSQKAKPHNMAAICPSCHHDIDNGPDLSQLERRELMARAIVLTHDALIRTGRLQLVGK